MTSRINHGRQNWNFDGKEWHCHHQGTDYATVLRYDWDDQWRGRVLFHTIGAPQLLTGLSSDIAPGIALAAVQGMIKDRLEYARNLAIAYWPYSALSHTHTIYHYYGIQAGCVQPVKPGEPDGPWDVTFHPLGIDAQPLPVGDGSQEHIYAQALGVILRRANELETILLG